MRERILATIMAMVLMFSGINAFAMNVNRNNSQSQTIHGIVVNCSEYVTLRQTPSTKGASLGKVYLGDSVLITSRAVYKDGGDYFVQVYANGKPGYILIAYIDAVFSDFTQRRSDHYGIGYGTVTANDPGDDLILRSGPGTEYAAIGYLFGGEVLPSTGMMKVDNDGMLWYCCALDDTICWISSKYTRLQTP